MKKEGAVTVCAARKKEDAIMDALKHFGMI